VGIGEGLEALREMGRPMAALYIGGMGARGKNFYNELFASYGYEKEAAEIQDLYLAGKKPEAAAAIPQSFIDATTLIGPESFVKDRLSELSAYRDNPIAIVCRTDQRSSRAAELLSLEGFNDIQVVKGGMIDWNKKGYQVL
jgi:rhodanese-related sulfurtransferase